GVEREAGLALGATQGLVVLDDAVAHHRHVLADVGMGVALTWHAVGGPAGVGDAGGAAHRLGLEGALEFAHLADGAHAAQRVAGDDRDARGIVAAILQAPKAVHQDRQHVLPAHRADYAAHISRPLEGWFRCRRSPPGPTFIRPFSAAAASPPRC